MNRPRTAILSPAPGLRASFLAGLLLLFTALAACSSRDNRIPPTQVVLVTRIVPVTQIVLVTQVISVTQVVQSSESVQSTRATPHWECGRVVQGMFQVSAASGWQDSGLKLPGGCKLKITASGTWTFNSRGGDYFHVGPDGYADTYVSSLAGQCGSLPFPSAPYGALIAKVAGWTVLVGSNYDSTTRDGGSLLFRINDDCMGDDEGQITVKIVASP